MFRAPSASIRRIANGQAYTWEEFVATFPTDAQRRWDEAHATSMLRQSPFDCRGGALQPAESTAGVRRIDSDGQAYTWQQFAATYGPDAPRFWDAAFHRSALRTAFDGKSYTFLQYLERYGSDAQRFWDNAEKVVVNASAEPKKDEENAAANLMLPIPEHAAVNHAEMEQLAPTPQVQPQRPHGTHRIAADNCPYTWLEF